VTRAGAAAWPRELREEKLRGRDYLGNGRPIA
jgi:hypothetical protein